MFTGLFIGVFGTLLGIQLYLWINPRAVRWFQQLHTHSVRRKWVKAGEQWRAVLDRIDEGVQSLRRAGPNPDVVRQIREELNTLQDMRLSEQEWQERQQRIAEVERFQQDIQDWNHAL